MPPRQLVLTGKLQCTQKTERLADELMVPFPSKLARVESRKRSTSTVSLPILPQAQLVASGCPTE
jgi:hypothetical protein